MKRTTKIVGVAVFLAVVLVGIPVFITVNERWDLYYTLTSVALLSIASGGVWLTFYIGRINIGQGAYALMGGYVSAILVVKYGVSFWLTLPIAGLFCGAASVLIGLPILRLRGVYFAMVTLVLTEVARLAYADRSKHLGDPGFYEVPVKWLTSKAYGEELAATIDFRKARNSEDIAPGVAPLSGSDDRTHFSIIDAEGNVVANTYTLNFSFGSGIAVAGAGFLLNNEMDDFSAKAGVPNAYGLLGGDANSVAAGKRPLSSMTPTIVFANGEPGVATGTPGGSRIITSVLQMIVNMIDHGMNLAAATAAPRMHHQWYPDVLQLESGFSPDTTELLEQRGHAVMDSRYSMGSLQSVALSNGVFRGASDPRRPNGGSVAPDQPATH